MPLPTTHRKAAAILIIIFLLGGIIGSAVTGMLIRNRLDALKDFTRADGFSDRILNTIGPIEPYARAQEVESILKHSGSSIEAMTQDYKTRYVNTIKAMEGELKPILTPEEWNRWIDARDRFRSRVLRSPKPAE